MWRQRFVDLILAHRRAVIGGVLLVTLIASFFAARLRFDSSIDIWFLEDDPDLLAYDAFLDRFEADEITVMALFADDLFTPERIAQIDRLTRAAEVVPFAHRVHSITNVRVPAEEGLGLEDLVATVPPTPEEARHVRERALANPLVAGGLVSSDARATAILIELERDGATFDGKVVHVEALQNLIAKETGDGVEIVLTGTPPFDEAFYRFSKRDFVVLAPAALLVILLSIYVVFRRFSAIIVPVSVVAASITWLFAAMHLLGLQLNVISSVLGTIILAVGVADSVHMVADYYQQLMAGREKSEAVRRTLSNLLEPCFFTSATTAVGMLSLQVSNLRPVREFGLLAASGVLVAFLLSITFVPCILTIAEAPDPSFVARQRHGPMARLLSWIGAPTVRRNAVVVASSLFVLGVGAAGWAKLEVGANSMNYLHDDSEVRVNAATVDRALGGSATIEVLVTAPDEGLKDPERLARIDAVERWLEGRTGVSESLSAVDSLKELNRVLSDDEAFRLPRSRELIAQLYLLLEGEQDFDAMVQDDYSIGRITSRIQMTEAERLAQEVPLFESYLAGQSIDGELDLEMTGFVKLMSNMESYLLDSQIFSLTIAFVAITLMLMLLLRSVKLGLFSMIPNILPIALGLSLMGWAGIALDPGTVMIGAIALGLVVDDTVHFLVRLRRCVARGDTLPASISSAVQDAGRPIIVTSAVLAAGMSILMLGSFSPNSNFGLVSGVVILVALAADLLLLPATLLIVRPRL